MNNHTVNYKRPEILSPGGDLAKLKTAILYGADAVYCAGPAYGLRAQSSNLSEEELAEAVAYAHERGVRVYVTVNIYPREDDMDGLPDYLRLLDAAGVDAVIVADPGVFSLAARVAPRLERHVSTQANITHAAAARFWYDLGATRVVLARELNFEEIRVLRAEISDDLEIECFVHGAMCMAYSGRCLLSSHFTGRDANRGSCSQPCRWAYTLTEQSRPDDPLHLEEDERGTYFMNSRDMCMIEHIPELIESGISSFKIEGRMKGLLYAGVTALIYSQAVDRYMEDPQSYATDPRWVEDLELLVHRRYGTGFYLNRTDEPTAPARKAGDGAQIALEGGYIRQGEFVGIVQASKNGRLTVEQRGKVFAGDELTLLLPGGRHHVFRASDLRDEAGEPIEDTPHARMIYSLAADVEAPVGALLRKDSV